MSQTPIRRFVTRFPGCGISFSVLTVQGIFTEMDVPTPRVPRPMIKSELVQRIAEHNPHLYQRDVENIVNAILDEIVAALARGDRVELRGFGAFSVKHRPAPARPQSAYRRPCAGRSEERPVFQDGQGNARAAEPRRRRTRRVAGPGR